MGSRAKGRVNFDVIENPSDFALLFRNGDVRLTGATLIVNPDGGLVFGYASEASVFLANGAEQRIVDRIRQSPDVLCVLMQADARPQPTVVPVMVR